MSSVEVVPHIIAGDLEITGNLLVDGTTTLVSTTTAGIVIIDVTDAEAFLVRKDADGGDVFCVDTTNKNVLLTASDITWASGKVVTATSYAVQRDADATNQLHFNVPTGASMEWSINDASLMFMDSTGRVGINTTSTNQRLVVSGNESSYAAIGAIGIYDVNVSGRHWAIYSGTPAAGALGFKVGTSNLSNPDTGLNVLTLGSNGFMGLLTTPAHVFHEVAGTLTDGVSAFYLSATMPSAISDARYAVNYQVTSAGNSAQMNGGFNVDYLVGYTGSSWTMGARITNRTAGTGTSYFDGSQANYGTYTLLTATTIGTHVGHSAFIAGGNQNIGVYGYAGTLKNSATNIGVMGIGRNTGTTPIQIGGFFGLNGSAPTFASAALMCDNSDQTSNIFVARDNGTAVFTIGDVATTDIVTLAGGTFLGGKNILKITGTFPANDADNAAITATFTGAGAYTHYYAGMILTLAAGYTGAGASIGLQFSNASAGTGTDYMTSDYANFGLYGAASGVTVGTNLGGRFGAANGNVNIGVFGKAITLKNSATNVGVLGLGRNTGTTPIMVGGYFGLNATAPTYASGALVANNSDQAVDIFRAEDNGTAVFRINDGGDAVIDTYGKGCVMKSSDGNYYRVSVEIVDTIPTLMVSASLGASV